MNGQYEVLNPWAEVDPPNLRGISSRVEDLSNKTIGLFDSAKVASRGVLEAIKEQLSEKVPTAKFSWFTADYYYHGQPHYREQVHQQWREKFLEWLKGVDTVVLAVGD